MMGSIQVEIIELLDSGVIEVHMDNGVIIRWVKMLYGGSEQKEAINGFGIPDLKHIGKEPEAEVCGDK